MDSKYYTPEIEDFSVDLECQVKYNEVWKDRKIRHGEDLCEIVSRYTTNKESVRVKYLDEQDILDCSFEKLSGDSNKITFKSINSSAGIYFYPDDRRKVLVYIDIYDYEGCIFDGYIKNKTELIKLLKQLGI
jgi:hypothetical protein